MMLLLWMACAVAPIVTETGGLVWAEDLRCQEGTTVSVMLEDRLPVEVFALDSSGVVRPWDSWWASTWALSVECPDTGAVRIVWSDAR